jgi:hypothetical protein
MITRGEAREKILAQAEALGERHGSSGQQSLRIGHNVISITDLIAAQAGVSGFKLRSAGWGPVVDPFAVAAAYSAAYAAATNARAEA